MQISTMKRCSGLSAEIRSSGLICNSLRQDPSRSFAQAYMFETAGRADSGTPRKKFSATDRSVISEGS